jgi:hypothetical protein
MMPVFVSLNLALAAGMQSREAAAGSLQRCTKSHHALIMAIGIQRTIFAANLAWKSSLPPGLFGFKG